MEKRGKNTLPEAFFKEQIYKIKSLHLGKSSLAEVLFGVRLGNCLVLFRHWAMPGPARKDLSVWC